MKKTICISPVDDKMEGWARAVYILNEFRRLGISTRSDFVENVIVNRDYGHDNYKKVQQLQNFWNMRDRSKDLLDDLEAVIEIIKNK